MAKSLIDKLMDEDPDWGDVEERKPIERGDASEPAFIEKCPSCDGSGEFRKRGRLVGPCFKCKGQGKRFFKTSSDKRERATALKYAKRLKDATDAFDLLNVTMTRDQIDATRAAMQIVMALQLQDGSTLRTADAWMMTKLAARVDLAPTEIALCAVMLRKYRRLYGGDLFARIYPTEAAKENA